jgi:soluble lytic murein transglycosylase-like protein
MSVVRVLTMPRPAALFLALLLTAPAWGNESQQSDPALRKVVLQAAQESESFPDQYEALVWLTDMSRRLETRIPDPQFRVELLKIVHAEATRAKLPPELVLAVIEVESAFDPYAISVAGARGLMQVMPFWIKEIGKPDDSLFRVHTNIRLGCTILRYYLDKEKGNTIRALMRYNGTRKWDYPSKVMQVFERRWRPS